MQCDSEDLIEDLIAEFNGEVTRIEAIIALKETSENFDDAANLLDELLEKRKKKAEKKQEKQ
jgi:hypothetical protein